MFFFIFKRKNDNNYYEEHDINVTSTATLTHNSNHNHKTHQKKLDYYTIKKPDDVVELNQKEEASASSALKLNVTALL